MSKSLELILSYIKEHTSIPLEKFFQIAVSDYYENCKPFGKDGDFITAPEVSQMFGEIIGINFAEHFLSKNIQEFSLIEIGGGNGTLMKDLLRGTKNIPKFHEELRNIIMIDSSKSLQKKQIETLHEFSEKLLTFESLDQLQKPNHPIFLVANELFDALPYQEFIKKSGKIYEAHIHINKKGNLDFIEVESQIHLDEIEENEIVEVSKASERVARKISEFLEVENSKAILIDYGYIDSPKIRTLQALKNHKKTNPLENIGTSDLTYLVDFKNLEKHFKKQKFKTKIVTQSDFLIQNGIYLRAEQLVKNGAKIMDIKKDLERLTSPDKMGALFKVLVIEK